MVPPAVPPRTFTLILLVVFACMAAEAWLAARNERIQRAFGGIEPPGDVYQLMRIAYPGAFLLMGAEAFWRWRLHAAGGGAVAVAGAPMPWLVAGLVVFALAKLLKWWAIASLGRYWTFRVIVVPGSSRVRSGPYRFLAHPNYVGVVGELAGAALMLGALPTGLAATIGFGYLIYCRVRVERDALATFVRGHG